LGQLIASISLGEAGPGSSGFKPIGNSLRAQRMACVAVRRPRSCPIVATVGRSTDQGEAVVAAAHIPQPHRRRLCRAAYSGMRRIVNPTPQGAIGSSVTRLDLTKPTQRRGGRALPRDGGCAWAACLASVSERGSRAWRGPARAYPASCAAGGGRSVLPSDALIELVLRCRLGMGSEATRPGIG